MLGKSQKLLALIQVGSSGFGARGTRQEHVDQGWHHQRARFGSLDRFRERNMEVRVSWVLNLVDPELRTSPPSIEMVTAPAGRELSPHPMDAFRQNHAQLSTSRAV